MIVIFVTENNFKNAPVIFDRLLGFYPYTTTSYSFFQMTLYL